MNAFSFSQKFGVYSLIISGVGVFLSLMVPNFGVLCAGLAGIIAWMSAGSGVFIGILTVILNLINLFIFCDISRFFTIIEATARTPDQNRVIVLWFLVFLVQVAAIILFLLFFVLKLLFGREKIVHDFRGTVRPDSANSAEYIGEVTPSGEWYKTIYALIVLVLFCLTAVVYVRPGLLPLTVFNSIDSINERTPADKIFYGLQGIPLPFLLVEPSATGISEDKAASETLSHQINRWMQIVSAKRELSFHIIDVFLMLVLNVTIFLTLIIYLILYDRPKPGLAT